jgi:very-short-patch-repair endonuclease
MPRIEHFSEVHETNMGGINVKHYMNPDGEMVFDDQQISNAYDVTREDIRAHFRRNKGKELIENEHWFKGTKPGAPATKFWTVEGIIKLGDFIKTLNASKILDFLGVKSRNRSRIESHYMEIIKNTFQDITPCYQQYLVGLYKVDLYFPKIKLAIEIDEQGHSSYNSINESNREENIRNRTGCKFIRINPDNPDTNIGAILNKILKYYLDES